MRGSRILLASLIALAAGAWWLWSSSPVTPKPLTVPILRESQPPPAAPVLGATATDIALHYLARQAVKEDAWQQGERKRFFAQLKRTPVVVVPAQIEGLGVDYAARLFFTGLVAKHLASIHGSVLDPFVIERATGEAKRSLQLTDAWLHRLPAERILVPAIGHDGRGQLQLKLRLLDWDWAANDYRDTSLWSASLAWSMLDAPELLIATQSAAIQAQLAALPTLRLSAAPAPVITLNASRAWQWNALSGLADPVSEAEEALLLAALTPNVMDWHLARISSKALLLLEGRQDARSQRLRAYALHRLERHAAARTLVEDDHSSAGRAFAAAFAGDLNALQAIASVDNPLESALLAIEAAQIKSEYQSSEISTVPQALAELCKADPVLSALAARWRARSSVWRSADRLTLKTALDAVAPVASLKTAQLVEEARTSPQALLLSVFRHVRAVYPDASVTPPAGATVGAADLLDTVDAVALEDWVGQVLLAGEIQVQPERAQQLVDLLQPAYGGHPWFSAAQVGIGLKRYKQAAKSERDGLWELVSPHLRATLVNSAGQTAAANRVLAVDTAYAKYLAAGYAWDLPTHPQWQGAPGGKVPEISADELKTRRIATLGYVLPEPNHFDLYALYEAGQLKHHPDVQVAKLERSVPDARQRGEQLIALQPWRAYGYQLLAEQQLRDGDPESAVATWRRAPEIAVADSASTDRVWLTRLLSRIGRRLLRAGEAEHARSFLVRAAALDVGSAAAFQARILLAQLDGLQAEALSLQLQLARRYQQVDTWAGYLALAFAAGEHKAAWAAFERIRDKPDLDLWKAAMLGWRAQSTSNAQLEIALRGQPGAGLMLVHWYANGRLIPKGTAQTIRRADQTARLAWEQGRSSAGLAVSQPVLQASGLAGLPVVAAGYESANAAFAEGLEPFQRGDFRTAQQAWLLYAARYPLESYRNGYALPYLAFAAIKNKDSKSLAAWLDQEALWNKNDPYLDFVWSFDRALARALLAGLARGDHALAIVELERARFNLRFETERPIPDLQLYLAVCRWLFEGTQKRAYADQALAAAKLASRLAPSDVAAHFTIAAYSTDPAERRAALAQALKLDLASTELERFNAAELNAARSHPDDKPRITKTKDDT